MVCRYEPAYLSILAPPVSDDGVLSEVQIKNEVKGNKGKRGDEDEDIHYHDAGVGGLVVDMVSVC